MRGIRRWCAAAVEFYLREAYGVVDDSKLGRGEHALALVPEPIAVAQPLELR